MERWKVRKLLKRYFQLLCWNFSSFYVILSVILLSTYVLSWSITQKSVHIQPPNVNSSHWCKNHVKIAVLLNELVDEAVSRLEVGDIQIVRIDQPWAMNSLESSTIQTVTALPTIGINPWSQWFLLSKNIGDFLGNSYLPNFQCLRTLGLEVFQLFLLKYWNSTGSTSSFTSFFFFLWWNISFHRAPNLFSARRRNFL